VSWSLLTQLSVSQATPAAGCAAPLSSTFHRRLLRLLSGHVIIDAVKPLRLASVLAGVVGLSLLVSACGGSSGSHVAQLGSATTATTTTLGAPSSTTSAASAQLATALAFARCMRSHGVSNFPDPGPQGQFPPFHSDSAASKRASLSANDACKSLRRSGGIGTPQDRQKKFAFALKVARCLRVHGFPSFPDPTSSSQSMPPGIDPNSSQFQTAEMNCEQQARKALDLS
jgi:hypothetical protein